MAKDTFPAERCARLLAALAAPERLKIVRFLTDGAHTVTEIAEMLRVPAVNVSHHLAVLKAVRLIQGQKRGRFIDYSLRTGVLKEVTKADGPRRALDLGCCKFVFPSDSPPARDGRSDR